MNPRFSLGIDLGTSNCAMAVADNDSDSTDVLPVTQIVAANQVGEMRTLPSACASRPARRARTMSA